MKSKRFVVGVFVAGFVLSLSSAASAVPYASGVRNTSGSTWEFVLNEAAENVTVLRDGGNEVDLGALTPGRYNFDTTGFSSWEIKVAQETPVAPWTQISDPVNNLFTHYERPTGLAVNTDPSSQYFGTVYVINSRTNQTASARPMGEGVYSMTADLKGVDLSTSNWMVTEPDDTSQARAPGWTIDPTQPLNPWRMSLDAGGNIIAGDWTDLYGGIKYATANLTSGGLVLAQESGPTGGVIGQNGLPVHGSIPSRPTVTGTVGTDLTVWAMDEDLDRNRTLGPDDGGTNTGHGNSVWRWDVGSATDYNIEPALTINVANIPRTMGETPTRANFLSNNGGVQVDAFYSPEFDKWYLTQRRSDGNEAGLIVVNADGVNGNSPTVAWSSLQFSLDNGLDGLTDGGPTGTLGIQDIFRWMGGGMAISPDGSFLAVHKVFNPTDNPYLGRNATDAALQGAVILIPLDANGVPDIQVTGPGGAITNLITIQTASNNGSSLAFQSRELVFDAAGNLYISSNVSELIQVYSPGGASIATTSSDGTFSLVPVGVATPGDHDGNGVVDARDYVVWRKNPAAHNGDDGYTDWVANFGTGTEGGGGDAVGAVPEPSSLALVMLGLLVVGARQRQSRHK